MKYTPVPNDTPYYRGTNPTTKETDEYLKNVVQDDYEFHPFHGMECIVCGISAFAHRHKKDTMPTDFERIDDLPKKTKARGETYAKWEDTPKETWTKDNNYFEFKTIEDRDKFEVWFAKELELARREGYEKAIERIENIPDKDVRPEITQWLEPKDFCVGYNYAIKIILATLREKEAIK